MISIVVNVDTRKENFNEGGLSKGVVSRDFLTEGLLNKLDFFNGFDTELIVFIDQHEPIDEATLKTIMELADTVVIRRHTNEDHFNDYNYLSALQLARGEYVVHFDQDTAAFTSDKRHIHYLLNRLEACDYISYPSHWTPLPVHDDSFDHVWASTRFFMCKRSTLDFSEIKKCLDDYEYCYTKYPANRKCHWLEHILGLISPNVYYPPIELDKYAIFSWGSYQSGLLNTLNELEYEEVKNFINSKGGIQYPNNIFV